MFYINKDQELSSIEYCVYVHTNKINGKKYVGQTCQEPNRRWMNGNGYLQKTENGNYRQPYFAKAIIKYGWDNFEHEIVASHLTKEEANNFEMLLIEKMQTTDKNKGYNICSGGNFSDSQKGRKFSEEHKKKLSETKKANKHDCKKVNQFTKDGEYIKTWESTREAERILHINHTCISLCCRGNSKHKTAGGFIWRYADEDAKAA